MQLTHRRLVVSDFVVLNAAGWTCPLSDVDEVQLVYVRGILCAEGSSQPIFGKRHTAAPCGGGRPCAPVPSTAPARRRLLVPVSGPPGRGSHDPDRARP